VDDVAACINAIVTPAATAPAAAFASEHWTSRVNISALPNEKVQSLLPANQLPLMPKGDAKEHEHSVYRIVAACKLFLLLPISIAPKPLLYCNTIKGRASPHALPFP
jgi:hypothetical protein